MKQVVYLPKLSQTLLVMTLVFVLNLGFPAFTQAQAAEGVQNFTGTTTVDNTLTKDTLDSLNPLVQFGDPTVNESFTTPGGIISRALVFAFPIAGLILFVMLVWAGFEILGGATEKKSVEAGKQRATAAVIGFVLLFASYWLIQILEVMFGVTIL